MRLCQSCFPVSRSEALMTKTMMAAVASILLCGPALGEEGSTDQIFARLLGRPVWLYEWGQPKDHSDVHGAAGKVETGKVSFADKDGKLVAAIEEGLKCDNAVRLRADGFDLEDCWGCSMSDLAMNLRPRLAAPTSQYAPRHSHM